MIFIASREMKPKRSLPILNPAQLNPSLVSPELQRLGVGHRVGDFQLIDQRGNPLTGSDVKGKIRVIEFFFTTCPSICKIMAEELQRVQAAYSDENRLMILSHTVMPEIDSVEILAAYGEAKNIDYNRWRLLTGEKSEIYRLAREVYFVVPAEDSTIVITEDNHDFIHTENIVLVDSKGRLRGFYDGTDEVEMNQLIEDIGILLGE
ncbi:MAG: SCO family protein [Cryomorphaceae bacterium]|nr:SCO family protein [Cryomorphaceae bacterium]